MGFWNVNQGLNGKWHIRLEMHFVLVIISAVHEFVEFFVFFFSDLVFVSGPDSFHEVDSITIDRDGEIDEVRVLVDDLPNLSGVSKMGVIFSQVQNDSGTSFN